MKIETMEELFLEQVEDLYDAVRRLVKGAAEDGRSQHVTVSSPGLPIPFNRDRRPRHPSGECVPDIGSGFHGPYLPCNEGTYQ
jgi:hypothetical protein